MTIMGRVLALLLAARAACALADDAVGVMRVDVGTNGLVGATMPFAPLSDSGPLGYISGAFVGDGGESSDRISVYDPLSGLSSDAVWAGALWFDPLAGAPSLLSACLGDSVFLSRSDCEQRACSEIRATKLSRDCQCGGRQRRHTLGLMNLRGFRGVYWEPEEECIKRTAKESTSMDLKCRWKIDEYVDSAYKKCANSNEPID